MELVTETDASESPVETLWPPETVCPPVDADALDEVYTAALFTRTSSGRYGNEPNTDDAELAPGRTSVNRKPITKRRM